MSDRPLIRFEKTSTAGRGDKPLGATLSVRWSRHAVTRDEAVRVAWRQFQRDMPNENPMCWTVADA